MQTQNRIKFINIDTRFNTERPCFPFADYYVDLPERIHRVKSLSIVSIELPISFFNICEALNNNVISIQDVSSKPASSPIKIKLEDSNYTLETISKTITNKLEAENIGDLKVDASNNKINFKSNTKDYVLDFNENNSNQPNEYSLHKLLGFKNTRIYIEKTSNEKAEKAEKVIEQPQEKTICNLFNPRYLYLEILEYEYHKSNDHNDHLFFSSILAPNISKFIIARIVLEYNTFPFGSVLPANIYNGLLISNTRYYKKHINLESLEIRLLNEFGFPICLNGFELSFCIQVECEEKKDT